MENYVNIYRRFGLYFYLENYTQIADLFVIVSRKNNKNVVIVSEREYNELMKAKRNVEYLAMLDESAAQLKAGNTISLSMEELKEMESENWKPSQKVIDFETKNNISKPGTVDTAENITD